MKRVGLLLLALSGGALADGYQTVQLSCPSCSLTQGSLTLINATKALIVSANSKICLNGSTCTAYVYDDGSNNWYGTPGGTHVFGTAILARSGITNDTGATTLVVNTNGIVIGDATTTDPIKIAGGSGAFVGGCTMSAAATCTVTVPTGAKCAAPSPASSVAPGASVPSSTVSSTTLTINSGGTANSVAWTTVCL